MSEEFKKYVNEKAKEARKVPDFPFNVSLREQFSICFPDLINTKWKLSFITRSDIDYEILIDDYKTKQDELKDEQLYFLSRFL